MCSLSNAYHKSVWRIAQKRFTLNEHCLYKQKGCERYTQRVTIRNLIFLSTKPDYGVKPTSL